MKTMAKDKLREQLKLERAQLNPVDRQKWDAQILEHLKNWDVYLAKRRAFVYLSIGWEVDTWGIVDDLVERGCEVYAPVVQKSPRALLPRRFTSRDELVPAVFGILEPPLSAQAVEPEELDLIIVPGLAFTRAGYRIGYGGGFYDRFLASTNSVSMGLCYSSFLRDDLIVDQWDKPVDYVVTERGVLGGNKGKLQN